MEGGVVVITNEKSASRKFSEFDAVLGVSSANREQFLLP